MFRYVEMRCFPLIYIWKYHWLITSDFDHIWPYQTTLRKRQQAQLLVVFSWKLEGWRYEHSHNIKWKFVEKVLLIVSDFISLHFSLNASHFDVFTTAITHFLRFLRGMLLCPPKIKFSYTLSLGKSKRILQHILNI